MTVEGAARVQSSPARAGLSVDRVRYTLGLAAVALLCYLYCMPKFTAQIITGTPRGYAYSDPRQWVAKSNRFAAVKEARAAWGDGDRPRLTVLVGEDVFVVESKDGKTRALRATTVGAAKTLRSVLQLAEEIKHMQVADAKSLMLTLESIWLGTTVHGYDNDHPATREQNLTLNDLDLLDGVRLFIHSTWDIAHMNDEAVQTFGGFSPAQPREDAP